MPKFVIERNYRLPVFEHVVIEAESHEAAMKAAIDDHINGEIIGWDNAKEDYENSGHTYLTAVVQVSDEDLKAHTPAYLLHQAGKTQIPIPDEFQE